MISLAHNNATAAAVVCDGPHDGQHFYVKPDAPGAPAELDADPYDVFGDDQEWFRDKRRYKFLSRQDRDRLRLAILSQAAEGELSEDLRPKASEMRLRLNSANKTAFKLPAGSFCLLPTAEPERLYVAGRSGAGKSVVAALYIREWVEQHPGGRVILLSTHDDEKAYESLPVQQMDLDEDFISDPPTVQELANSLVVFDDVDNLQDKKLQAAVGALQNDLIANGRKHGIWTVNLNHQLTDYSRTRHLLNEASRVVFFPGGTTYHISRYLKVYAGLSPLQIKRVLAVKSRWVCLGLGTPMYVLSEHELFILPRE